MTEMIDETEGQEHVQDAVETQRPGRRLREVREEKGLTREEVASQLRLQVRLIEALEEDDEKALPPSTFVSGYLRSYARLLDIPEDTVVPPPSRESEPRLVATIANKGEASSRDWPARIVTYLVVIVIAVSVAMWWLSQRDNNGTDELLSGQEAQPEVMEQGGNINLALPESEVDAAQDSQFAVDGESTEAEMTELEAETDQGTEAAAVTEETQVESAKTENDKSTSSAVPPLKDATPQAKLELRYETDSWTEVTDSAGRQLAYGLVKAGEVRVLRGEAPFRVFLGYASGVNVYYNDDLFDHSPFQRRDVARFRVGRAEHNHPGSR